MYNDLPRAPKIAVVVQRSVMLGKFKTGPQKVVAIGRWSLTQVWLSWQNILLVLRPHWNHSCWIRLTSWRRPARSVVTPPQTRTSSRSPSPSSCTPQVWKKNIPRENFSKYLIKSLDRGSHWRPTNISIWYLVDFYSSFVGWDKIEKHYGQRLKWR